MPKCSGTSINTVFQQHFRPRVLTHSDHALVERFEAMSPDERDAAFDCVTGHIQWGLHRKFGRRALYVSAVRDPLERLCSYFNYVHLEPNHPLHETLGRELPDLNGLTHGWLAGHRPLRRAFNNQICRTYAGKPVSENNYQAFEKRVLSDMKAGRFVVGTLDVVERWMAQKGFISDEAPLPHQNRSGGREGPHDFVPASPAMLEQKVRRLLIHLNGLDYRLIEAIGWANYVAGAANRPPEGWQRALNLRAQQQDGPNGAPDGRKAA